MSRRRDDDGRTRAPELAGTAIARKLQELGLTVPASLTAMCEGANEQPLPVVDRMASRRARLEEHGWPARAMDHATSPTVITDAIRAIRDWDRDRSAFVLAGPKGTGKSVAAAWRALRDDSRFAFRFVRAATIVRLGRFGEAWATCLAAPALCIDDLGSEYVDTKGSFVADLDELVDTFYSERRALVITTNLPGKEFRARYGARIVDRLTECAVWADVDGKSLRAGVTPERPPWEES